MKPDKLPEQGEKFVMLGGVLQTSHFVGVSFGGWATCKRCGNNRIRVVRQMEKVWEGKKALAHLEQCKEN